MTAPVTSAVASEEALRNAITATTEQIANRLVDFYQNASGFLHARDQAIQIARIAEQVAPLVEAGQLNVGELVNARLSQTFRVAEPPPVSAAILGRTGVDLPTEYARPLWSAVQASRRGASDVEALAVAARRAKQQVGTDMQMARVKQSREVVRRSRYRHYRRVANPGACPLCRIAATQLYHSEALLPIHGGTCRCGVEPVEDGETQADLDRALDVKSLAAAEDQKKLLGQAVEDGKGAADFRDMIAVREHSETGPTLTWKHQKFQTAEDLGIKSPTLSIDAYERVREGGGVTINLEEGAPSNGFAYAPRKDTEFRVAEADFKPEHIDRYVDSHLEDLAKPGNHLGIWVQDGNVYIDISRVGKPDVSTILEAQAADQLAVYDLGNRREINIGRITNGKYVRIDEAANLYNQYQRQVAGTDQTRSAASVLKVPAGQAASRAATAERSATRVAAAAERKAKKLAKIADERGRLFAVDADAATRYRPSDLPSEDVKSIRRFGGVDYAVEAPPKVAVTKSGKAKVSKSGKAGTDWGGTWRQLPPISVDINGNIVDEALDSNLRRVLLSANQHEWAVRSGDRWYPDYGEFVRAEWESVGRRNPVTGKPMTFDQAMDASGAFAINAEWNETMAYTHMWLRGQRIPNDPRFVYADNASQTHGYWHRAGASAPKIDDFTLNGNGHLATATTDRWMARLALGTDDGQYAQGMLGAGNAGSYVDPATGETVKLSGYQRISRAIGRVSRELGAPNEAAGQARMWIEFFGPEAAYGLPPDELVAQGKSALNAYIKQRLAAEARLGDVPTAVKQITLGKK